LGVCLAQAQVAETVVERLAHDALALHPNPGIEVEGSPEVEPVVGMPPVGVKDHVHG
jgi:hypothetical protein